jgi:hypothetical protein
MPRSFLKIKLDDIMEGKRETSWRFERTRRYGSSGWVLSRPKDDEGSMENAAMIFGKRADFVLPLLIDVMRRQGADAKVIKKKGPLEIPEEEGYRLALAFELLRFTDSSARMESILEAIRSFEAEESYLWYSYLALAKMNGKEGRLAVSMAHLGEAMS